MQSGTKAHSPAYVPAAEIPAGPVPVPRRVRELAHGDSIDAVWVNELGGVTFRLGAGTERDRHVKWSPLAFAEADLRAEAERLQWARERIVVPLVLELGDDGEHEWLVTRTIVGRSAVDPAAARHPHAAAAAIGEGLRVLHESLVADSCPFSWSVDDRRARFEQRRRDGMTRDEWMPEHRSLTFADAERALASAPAVERAVVCHGDACAPNTLVDDANRFVAHVDLGHLGVADRWADLAVASWSLEWNFGPGFETDLFGAYGVERDEDRIAYYRLLWDLT